MININANINIVRNSGEGAPASSLLNGLIHVWTLDEDGTSIQNLRMDNVGSSHLTPAATLVTPVQGKKSFCYKNTNSDDPYLYTDDAALRSELTGGSWTISTWVNKTNVLDSTFGDTVLGVWGLDSQRCFTVRLQPDNTIALHLSTNGTSTTVLNHSVVMNLGQWYHIAIYFDRETKTAGLSVNGSVPATTVLGDFLFESTASFAIGNITNPNTLGLNGLIDEVYMWNRVLSPPEITELISPWYYDTLQRGLIHGWDFDESGTGIGDLRRDLVGSDDLTPTATLMTQAAGKSGLAYTNDGSLRFLSVDSDGMRNIVNGSFTFSVWINLSSIDAHSGIFSCWDASQDDRSYLLLYSSGQGLRWLFSPNGTQVIQGDNVHSISANTWYHVVCWFDKPAGKFRMSVDNGPTTEADVTSIHKSSHQFTIGSYIPVGGGIQGLMNGRCDELYCWNRLLTQNEITELYNSGAGKFYPFND